MSDEGLRQAYQDAIRVGNLPGEQKDWLLRSALQRSASLAEEGREALHPALISMAAVLMASNERLSSLSAIALGEKIALIPGLGDALISIQDGLNCLASDSMAQQLAQDSLSRSAVSCLLRSIVCAASQRLGDLTAMGAR